MPNTALMGLLAALALGPCAAEERGVADGFRRESWRHEGGAAPELAYTTDYWSAISGGTGGHDRVIANLDLVLPADLDRLFGLARTRALVHVIHNNGASFSGDVTGDLQAISNIETGTRMTRPLQAWVEHHGHRNDWSVRVGLYDVNSEFDSLDASGVFLSGAHGMGTDIAQSGRNGPSTFPITSLGIRFARTLSPSTVLRIAVLDGVPDDAENLQRSTININAQEGAFSIAESISPENRSGSSGERGVIRRPSRISGRSSGRITESTGAWVCTSGAKRFRLMTRAGGRRHSFASGLRRTGRMRSIVSEASD